MSGFADKHPRGIKIGWKPPGLISDTANSTIYVRKVVYMEEISRKTILLGIELPKLAPVLRVIVFKLRTNLEYSDCKLM